MHKHAWAPQARHHRRGHVPAADRAPGRKDEYVALLKPSMAAVRWASWSSPTMAMGLGTPPAPSTSAEIVWVLMSLICPGARLVTRQYKLVSRRHDRDAGPFATSTSVIPRASSPPDILWPDHVAGCQHRFAGPHVLAYLNNVLARGDGTKHLDCGVVYRLRVSTITTASAPAASIPPVYAPAAWPVDSSTRAGSPIWTSPTTSK